MSSKRIGANATSTGISSGAKAPALIVPFFPAVETAGYKGGEIQRGGKPLHSMRPERQLRGCCYS
jgi:hypothetical protein